MKISRNHTDRYRFGRYMKTLIYKCHSIGGRKRLSGKPAAKSPTWGLSKTVSHWVIDSTYTRLYYRLWKSSVVKSCLPIAFCDAFILLLPRRSILASKVKTIPMNGKKLPLWAAFFFFFHSVNLSFLVYSLASWQPTVSYLVRPIHFILRLSRDICRV